MDQRGSIITLGVNNLETSRKFYAEGFGWKPGFENKEIIFFQTGGMRYFSGRLPDPLSALRSLFISRTSGRSAAIRTGKTPRQRWSVGLLESDTALVRICLFWAQRALRILTDLRAPAGDQMSTRRLRHLLSSLDDKC
jgi:hypothetical protein